VRLRLLLPGRRGGAGLRGLSRRAAAGLAAALVLAGCGEDRPDPQRSDPRPAPAPTDRRGLVTGLAEANAALLLAGDVPRELAPWRDRAAALRPRFFRLVLDWRKVQPQADVPPNWDVAVDGCLRGTPPCAPSRGVRDLLRAVRSRQQADGGWEVVVVPFGVPDWAAAPAEGCGAVRLPSIDAYRALLGSLRRLGDEEGVRLRWWAPWNEPNHPAFLSPQRSACAADAAPVSPDAYAELARAARDELGPDARLVLGELAGYDRARPRATAAAEFAAALPRDVACSGAVWGQHAYVGQEGSALAGDPDAAGSLDLVDAVLAALDAHACPQRHRVWITETGVGGPRAGAERPADRAALVEGCRAMDSALRAWARHPRVEAAFQYTFREDTAFPVGLVDAALTRTYPSYDVWRGWGVPGPPPAPAC
jgi:hypothetical protein